MTSAHGRVGVGIVGVLLLMMPSGAYGQDVPDTGRNTADIDSLVRALHSAWVQVASAQVAHDERVRAERAREARPEEIEVAHGRAGPWRVIASRKRLPRLERAVESAWDRFAPHVTDPDAILRTTDLVVEWDNDPSLKGEVETSLNPEWIMVEGGYGPWPDPADQMREFFSRLLARPIPVARLASLDEGEAYRTLVLSEAAPVKACLAGDAHSCWRALGLTEADPPWMAWTDETELPRIAAAFDRRNLVGEAARDYDMCLQGRHTESCQRFLATLSPAQLSGVASPPLGHEALQDLTFFAVRRGGRGSIDRLSERPKADYRDRLTSASGMSADELVLTWVRTTLETGIDRTSRERRARSSAFVWFLLLMLPAARSTRWRVK